MYFCFKQACLRSSCPPLVTQSCETQSAEYRKQKTKISITPQQDWAWNLVKKIHWLIVVTSKYVPLVVLFAVDVKAERAGCAIIPFLLFDVIHNDKTTANAIAQTRIPTSRPWKNVDVQHCLISGRGNILQKSKIKTLVYQIHRYLLCHWLVTHRSPQSVKLFHVPVTPGTVYRARCVRSCHWFVPTNLSTSVLAFCLINIAIHQHLYGVLPAFYFSSSFYIFCERRKHLVGFFFFSTRCQSALFFVSFNSIKTTNILSSLKLYNTHWVYWTIKSRVWIIPTSYPLGEFLEKCEISGEEKKKSSFPSLMWDLWE